MRCGFRPEGSEALYTPEPIDFALSRTSRVAPTATTGVAVGDFAGSGEAVGVPVAGGAVDAVGAESVVAADGVGARLAAAAAPAGTCADDTPPLLATVKNFVASS
jgi:hypothetical protein